MASLEDIGLEFAFDATVMVGEPLVLGATGVGVRRIVPITGGVVAGPAFNGVVLAGGADWQVMRDDGFTEIEARYTIKGEDGALIYVRNPGLRVAQADVIARLNAGEAIDPSDYYFRTQPCFETASARHAWMNRRLFVGRGVRLPDRVLIRVYQVT